MRVVQLWGVAAWVACSTAVGDGLAQPKLEPEDLELWCGDEEWGSYPCGSTGYGYVEAELLNYSTSWEDEIGLNVCRAKRLVRSDTLKLNSNGNRSLFWGPDSAVYSPVGATVAYPHWNTDCAPLSNWSANDDLTGKRCSDSSVPPATSAAFMTFCNQQVLDAGNGLESIAGFGWVEARNCTLLDQVHDNFDCSGAEQDYSSYLVQCDWGVRHTPPLEEVARQSASFHCVDDNDTFDVFEPDDPAGGTVTVTADACTCTCTAVPHGYTCFNCYKFAYLGNVEEVVRDPFGADISANVPVPGLMIGTSFTGPADADAACETQAHNLRLQLYGNDPAGQPIYAEGSPWGLDLGYCDQASCVVY